MIRIYSSVDVSFDCGVRFGGRGRSLTFGSVVFSWRENVYDTAFGKAVLYHGSDAPTSTLTDWSSTGRALNGVR